MVFLPALFALLPLAPPVTPLVAAPPSDVAASSAPASRELWYGIFLGGRQAGYLARERRANAVYEGKAGKFKATYTRMTLRMEVRAQGAAVSTRKERVAWTTPAGALLEEAETAEGNGVKRVVRAVYSGRSVTYTADLGDGKPARTGTLTIGPEEAFYARDPFDVSTAAAAVTSLPDGKRVVRYRDFNPDTLALEDATLALGRRTDATTDADALREVIAVGGAAVRASKRPFALDGSEGVSYEDEHGEMLRVDLGPLRIVRLPKEEATAPAAETDRPDVAEAGSYTPDKPITDARRLRRALYRIEGLTAPPVVEDDEVQRTASEKRAEGGDYASLVTIEAAPLTEGATPLASVPRDKFKAHLAPSLYVPANDPRIVALARKVVGDEMDAGRAAAKLSAHVHKALVYDAGAGYGPQRSAVEILQSGRGVCQDYATLLVALLRAAGVPAKHCSGLAYVDGRFYRHAWVEAWAGRWAALEPTWGEPFADATHIKLAEGEPTTDRPAAARLDALKVFVLQTSAAGAAAASTEENAP